MSDDERAVRDLDHAWNKAYSRHDRSALTVVLADDFIATTRDGRTATKAQLMVDGGSGVVTFSDFALHLFGPTAVTRGRIRVEQPDGSVEQQFVRIYSKRNGRWQAVAAQAFPVTSSAR